MKFYLVAGIFLIVFLEAEHIVDVYKSERELDRKSEIQKICLSEKLNGDFSWKIERCAKSFTNETITTIKEKNN